MKKQLSSNSSLVGLSKAGIDLMEVVIDNQMTDLPVDIGIEHFGNHFPFVEPNCFKQPVRPFVALIV